MPLGGWWSPPCEARRREKSEQKQERAEHTEYTHERRDENANATTNANGRKTCRIYQSVVTVVISLCFHFAVLSAEYVMDLWQDNRSTSTDSFLPRHRRSSRPSQPSNLNATKHDINFDIVTTHKRQDNRPLTNAQILAKLFFCHMSRLQNRLSRRLRFARLSSPLEFRRRVKFQSTSVIQN